MNTRIEITLPDSEATVDLGRRIAALARAGDLIVLTGELGAGKTTLTRGIAEVLRVHGRVASPTFIIAREHAPAHGGIGLIHVDAYRLNSIAEVDSLDLDSSMDEAVTVVEWGQNLVEGLAHDRLEVDLLRPRGTLQETEEPPRSAVVRGVGRRWSDVELAAAVES